MQDFGISPISLDVYDTLSLLRPFDIDAGKVRIGNERDGGYVMADIMAADQDLMSFGISNDVGFERVMAERGHRCFMYDHTIDGLPEHHDRFQFERLGISGSNPTEPALFPLDHHLKQIPAASSELILKIDVEGAEWDVFSTLSPSDLGRYQQITGEFHWFLHLDDTDFRTKVSKALKAITRQFTLFHVHANNCRPLGFVGGFAAADVLELSFVRSDLVQRRDSRTLYPSRLDKGNNHVVHDHALFFFPFTPTPGGLGSCDELIARLDGERVLT